MTGQIVGYELLINVKSTKHIYYSTGEADDPSHPLDFIHFSTNDPCDDNCARESSPPPKASPVVWHRTDLTRRRCSLARIPVRNGSGFSVHGRRALLVAYARSGLTKRSNLP